MQKRFEEVARAIYSRLWEGEQGNLGSFEMDVNGFTFVTGNLGKYYDYDDERNLWKSELRKSRPVDFTDMEVERKFQFVKDKFVEWVKEDYEKQLNG